MNEAPIDETDVKGDNQVSSEQKMEYAVDVNQSEAKQLPQGGGARQRSKKKQKWKKLDMSLEPNNPSHSEEVTQPPQTSRNNAWSQKAIPQSQDNTTRYHSNQPSRKTVEEER